MTWFAILKETEEAPMDEEMPMEDMPMDDMGGDMGGDMPMDDMGEEPVEEGSQPRNLHGGEEFQVDPENDENVEKWFDGLKKKSRKKPKELGNFRFRMPYRTIRDRQTGKVKDIAIRSPVTLSTEARRKAKDKRLRETVEANREKPVDPFSSSRAEYNQAKKKHDGYKANIKSMQSQIKNAEAEIENRKTEIMDIKQEEKSLALQKKPLPDERYQQMKNLNQQINRITQQIQNKQAQIQDAQKEASNIKEDMEENRKFLDIDDDTGKYMAERDARGKLNERTNFLEGEYQQERGTSPQIRQAAQRQIRQRAKQRLGVSPSDDMQNPKQRQGWFSKLKNPFTSALAEHQQKLSGGSMSPDAKAKKIVPPKRQRGKYQP